MPNIDFVTDQNPSVYLFMRDRDMLPDYVLKSNKITPEDTAALNKVAFADQAHRLYPCHTKSACWQSAAYFASKHEDNAHLKEAIEKMAAHHGIEEDVQKVFAAFEDEFRKAAATEPSIEKKAYALELDMGGFQGRGVEKFYPINDRFEIVRAAEDSTADYKHGTIPMYAMRKIAYNIMEAAEEQGVPVSELTAQVQHLGTRRLPDPYAAETLVGMRKRAGADVAPYTQVVKELQEKVAGLGAIEAIEAADETAKEIYFLDKEAGVAYRNGQLDPYDLLFTGPMLSDLEKAAASTVSIKGINVPVEDVVNLADSTIDNVFSKASGDVIKQAKSLVSGESTVSSCVEASELIGGLDDSVQKVLLGTLANTAW